MKNDDTSAPRSKCPEQSAPLPSFITFWWLNPLIHLGYHRPLEETDMYELREDMRSNQLNDKFEEAWSREKEETNKRASQPQAQSQPQKGKTPGDGGGGNKINLVKVLWRVFGRQYGFAGLLLCLITGVQYVQPFLLQWFINWIVSSYTASPEATSHGYIYAAFMFICPCIYTLGLNVVMRLSYGVAINTRSVLTTALFRKSLKLSPKARGIMSTGQIVNMMSTDTSKIDLTLQWLHFGWTSLLSLFVAIGLLINAIGPAALAGIAVMVVLMPVQAKVMSMVAQLRRQSSVWTDSRVKLMNEILQGIRVIKVYAWESSFAAKLETLRQGEMALVLKSQYIRAFNSSLMQIGPVFMSVIAFLTLAGSNGGTLNPASIFSALVLFNLLRTPLIMVPMILAFTADALVSIDRIQTFLMAEELQDQPLITDDKSYAIRVTDAEFTWEIVTSDSTAVTNQTAGASASPSAPTSPSPSPSPSSSPLMTAPSLLRDLSLTIPRGQLTIIVGAVGSGKSSLLNAVIGEMKKVRGEVCISGTVGYVSQQAWIQNCTLKDNILFGQPFEKTRYEEAIRVSCLGPDLSVLPGGDMTEIGEKGINLSGGQKQRVSLARSVYFNSDIVLLDDPLSALDAHVGKAVFEEMILGALAGKTRVLVTHQLQYVVRADYVIFMKDGRVESEGSYEELMSQEGKHPEFKALIDTYVGGNTDTEEEEEEEEEEEGEEDGREEKEEEKENHDITRGTAVEINTTKRTKKNTSNNKKKSNKSSSSSSSSSAHDKTKDASSKEGAFAGGIVEGQKADEKSTSSTKTTTLMSTEERARGGLSFDVYWYYVKALGGPWVVAACVAALAISQGLSIYTNYWLSSWTDDSFNKGTGFYMWVYAVLAVGQAVALMSSIMFIARMGCFGGIALHDQSFSAVLRAPMHFYDTTPLGRIVNRFSKDQDVVDTLITDSVRMFLGMFLLTIGTLVLITVVQPFFLVGMVPLMGAYLYIQAVYRTSSREVKRLDSVTRSPLFAHFSETLTGLPTIRAYRQSSRFIADNFLRLDNNNRPYFVSQVSQRWLAQYLELIGAALIFTVAVIGAAQRNSGNAAAAGQMGLILSYAMNITSSLSWMIRQSVEAENYMNSVERSKYYTEELPKESPPSQPGDEVVIKKNWPHQGEIQLKNVSMRYRPGLPLVLNGVSALIKPGEKIGIVGRTGAGKSSMMVSLFRLVELAGGSIEVDGVDISTLGLTLLRSKMAIIPQDPVLYSGTIRTNLDPFKSYSDAELWSVLDKCFLREAVEAMEGKLEAVVAENGENLSVGQRCQVCLGRAMLRNAKILIMDEATASVDLQTDAWIQESLRSRFSCTIMTIAHRLNTIIDYDRVMVLSGGSIVEFDAPALLLRNPSSIFTALVNETGEENAALLKKIAADKLAGTLSRSGESVAQMLLLAGGKEEEKKEKKKKERKGDKEGRNRGTNHDSALSEVSVSTQVTFHDY